MCFALPARAVVLAASLLLAGCGGGGSTETRAVSVSVSPETVTVPLGTTQSFAASVSGGRAVARVQWSVQEGIEGGAVTADGLYTAPLTAGTYHVVATSIADPTKSATATVTVPIEIQIHPLTATTTIGDTRTFTGIVAGTTNKAVTWTVQEGVSGGTVSPEGVYTPPAVPGTYHVTATSQADPTRSATAEIVVQAGNITGGIR
jgi:hypothetical protein